VIRKNIASVHQCHEVAHQCVVNLRNKREANHAELQIKDKVFTSNIRLDAAPWNHNSLLLFPMCQVVYLGETMVRGPYFPRDHNIVCLDQLLHGHLYGPGGDTQGQSR